MVQIWMSWCRLCAREDPSNSHINLLLKDEEGLPFTDTITKCFSIDVNNLNNLPKMICTDCYNLVRTNIELNQRIVKVSALFAELEMISEEELDVHVIKSRYNLESDFKGFAYSHFENAKNSVLQSEVSQIDEQMIDHDLMDFKETVDPNPISIKIEEDERHKYGRLSSNDEKSSNRSPEKANDKDKHRTKKKYKSRKERRAPNKNKPHHCSECGKSFMKLHNYRGHMKSSHDITIDLKPPLFICENCGKEYKSISALKEHEHSHTEERTLKCKYCEKTFKGIPSLRQHEDTHNETNYICVVCGLKLNTQRTLRMHMVVHSNQKKYRCDDCGNEFKRAKDLKNHLILHTGLKPYSCDFCERTFASGSNCRSHKKKSHPVQLAAQEAAGKSNISKVRIPKLRELKAVTATKAELYKPKKQTKECNERESLEAMSTHNTSLPLKSDVIRPNNLQKPLDATDFLQGILGEKYIF